MTLVEIFDPLYDQGKGAVSNCSEGFGEMALSFLAHFTATTSELLKHHFASTLNSVLRAVLRRAFRRRHRPRVAQGDRAIEHPPSLRIVVDHIGAEETQALELYVTLGGQPTDRGFHDRLR